MTENPTASLMLPPCSDAEVTAAIPPSLRRMPAGASDQISLHRHFEDQAARRPDAVAVYDRCDVLTYRDLNRRANQLAWFLRQRGVTAGSFVVVCLERSADLIVAQLGILKAGGTYVPMDVAYPAARIGFMVADTGARLLLTHSNSRADLGAIAAEIVFLDKVTPTLASFPDGEPPPVPPSLSPAYVIYTSGTTGRPKGVMVPHGAVVRLAVGQDFLRCGENDRFLVAASPAFDAIVFEIWVPLLIGAACVVHAGRRVDLEALETLVRERRVSCLFLTASLFNQIIDVCPQLLAAVREVVIGGEALSPKHVRQAMALLPGVGLINGYGPTECTVFACAYRILAPESWSSATVPIGQPIADTTAHIVDAYLRPIPRGEVGELLLGGPRVAQGYLNDPVLTEERFVRDPWSDNPAARLYRTGDLCRWLPNGCIEYLGRNDCQVKVRGFRIELGEIETALRDLDGVNDAVVTLRDVAGARSQLVAFVVAKQSATLTASALLDALRTRLPEPMIPRRIEWCDSLPLTPNGKINRDALAVRPLTETATAGSQFGEETRLEDRLIRLWRDLLSFADADAHTDFFGHGGDSLLAVQLTMEIWRQTGVKPPIGAVFSHTTPATLAAYLKQRPSDVGSVGAVRGDGPGPVLFYVPALYGVSRLPPGLADELKGVCRYFEGLYFPGVDGQEPLQESVEDIAAALVCQIEAAYPEGPLCLCGLSFGGLVAYETAIQLTARGRSVARVILGNTVTAEETRWRGPGERAWIRVAEFTRAPLRELPGRLRVVAGWVRLRVRGVAAHRDGHSPMQRACVRAFERYRPTHYAGPVAIIKTRPPYSPFLEERDLPDCGWGARLTGEFSVHPVECEHQAMLDGGVNHAIGDILLALARGPS